MARPRAATYDDQRAQILKAAAVLFARRGYTAATLNEVASASGVSKATLYHYFSDKHALLETIVRTHVERLEHIASEATAGLYAPAQAPREAFAAPETPEAPTSPSAPSAPSPVHTAPPAPPVPSSDARLRDLIRRFMQVYADAQSEHRVLTEDVKFLDERARSAVLDGQRRVVAAFAQGIAACRPGLDADLHKPLAMLLFGMINWTFTWLRPDGALTYAALGDIVADLFFGGLPAVAAPLAPAQAGRAPGGLR